MQFQVGESVSLLHEVGSYTIVSIDGHKTTILDQDGFSYQVATKDLIKRTPMDGPILEKEADKSKNTGVHLQKSKIPTLDLHAISLGIDYLQPNQILEQQLAYCRTFLNQCIDKHHSKAIIIHGIGEGVLKNAVRQLLSQKTGIVFHDGNYSFRGVGSTLIEIRHNQVSKF